MVLRISVVILTVLCLVILHFLVVFVQVLAYFPSCGVSDSEVVVESEDKSDEDDLFSLISLSSFTSSF